MRVRLESTTRVVEINGAPARVWEGTTDSGIKCYAAIPFISVHKDSDNTEFERELQRLADPSPRAMTAIPNKLVL